MQTDVLIVGGGLSGLRLAHLLSVTGTDFRLIEARNRLGGRILSLPASGGDNDDRYDLGPAWFWPDQPRIHRLSNELDLAWFEQMSSGNLVVQEQGGEVRNNFPFSTMAGARRLVGSMQTLIEALAQRLESSRLFLGHRLQSLEVGDNRIEASIETLGADDIRAGRCNRYSARTCDGIYRIHADAQSAICSYSVEHADMDGRPGKVRCGL